MDCPTTVTFILLRELLSLKKTTKKAFLLSDIQIWDLIKSFESFFGSTRASIVDITKAFLHVCKILLWSLLLKRWWQALWTWQHCKGRGSMRTGITDIEGLHPLCLKVLHSCYSSLMRSLGFLKNNNKKTHWIGLALVGLPKYKGLMLDFSRLSVFIKLQWTGLMSRLLS